MGEGNERPQERAIADPSLDRAGVRPIVPVEELLLQDDETLEEFTESLPRVPRRRHIYTSSEWSRISPRLFRCQVTVQSADGTFTGTAEGPEIPALRAEIAARATLDALNRAESDRFTLTLKGARALRLFGTPVVVVGVYGTNGRATTLVGSCPVRSSVEQSAILATLQAADRWLAWQNRLRR